MKKSFVEKVIKYGRVDTCKYRYIADVDFHCVRVYRLPIELLNTTAALTDWAMVYEEYMR